MKPSQTYEVLLELAERAPVDEPLFEVGGVGHGIELMSGVNYRPPVHYQMKVQIFPRDILDLLNSLT